MATHAPRMADPKGDDGALKNGTAALEDSDDSSNSGVLAKSRSPAAHQGMDGFQDGGPNQGGYPQQPHYPATGYSNNSGDPDPSFRPDYGGEGYRYDDGKMYPQHAGMRPPFSPQRAPYPRFGSQTGPTPTLNQLLQAPNQRYNSYEYPKDYPNNSWPRYPQQHTYRNQQGEGKRPYHPQQPMSSSSPYPPPSRHPSYTQPQYGQGGQQQQPYVPSTPPQHVPPQQQREEIEVLIRREELPPDSQFENQGESPSFNGGYETEVMDDLTGLVDHEMIEDPDDDVLEIPRRCNTLNVSARTSTPRVQKYRKKQRAEQKKKSQQDLYLEEIVKEKKNSNQIKLELLRVQNELLQEKKKNNEVLEKLLTAIANK